MRALIPALIALALASFARASRFPEVVGPQKTRSFPYSMCGQLLFHAGEGYYQGSGTVIQSRSLLTAGHNLWDARDGWSYSVTFNRARHGRSTVKRTNASRIFVLGGYRQATLAGGSETLRAFSLDLGGVRFATPPAGGDFMPWRAATSLLTNPRETLCVGYGAEFHDGNHLLQVKAINPFRRTTGGFFESSGILIESGMSGGPVFSRAAGGRQFVTGVVVSGSTWPAEGGIRVIDAKAADFIRSYLSL